MKLQTLLLALIAGELLLGGYLATRRWAEPSTRLPAAFPDDPPLAAELAVLATAARSGDASAWMALGDALLGKGFYHDAEDAYRQATQRAPQDIEARFALAFCIDRSGRMAEANEQYQRCLDLPDPPHVEQSKKPFAAYAIGRNLLRLEDEAAAEAVFRKNPGFLPAEYQLARILFFSDRPKEALDIVERGLTKLPLSLEWHRLRGRILEALDRPDEAFTARAMEERSAHLLEVNFNVDYIRPLTTRCGIKRMLAVYEAATRRERPPQLSARLDAIDAAIGKRLIPERITVDQLKADLAMGSGNAELVLQIIDTSPVLRDSDPLIAVLEADALERLGRLDEATTLRQKLITIAPSAALHRQLAAACQAAGDSAGREQHLAHAAVLDGIAAYRRNDLSAALVQFEQAVGHDPTNVHGWFHRGEMLYHLGRQAEALVAFREAVAQRPGFGRARDFITHLAN
jgi:tetratricopeptide (TPR) repeat protein